MFQLWVVVFAKLWHIKKIVLLVIFAWNICNKFLNENYEGLCKHYLNIRKKITKKKKILLQGSAYGVREEDPGRLEGDGREELGPGSSTERKEL